MKRWAASIGVPKNSGLQARQLLPKQYISQWLADPCQAQWTQASSEKRKCKTSRGKSKIALASLRPTPVRVTTPITKPVQAQAAETPNARRPPFSIASKMSFNACLLHCERAWPTPMWLGAAPCHAFQLLATSEMTTVVIIQ